MPLSEHEQRLLEQIEQGLYAEDPKFAATVRKVRPRRGSRRRVALAVVGAVIGLGVVVVAMVTKLIILGVVGFLVIVRERRPEGPDGRSDPAPLRRAVAARAGSGL